MNTMRILFALLCIVTLCFAQQVAQVAQVDPSNGQAALMIAFACPDSPMPLMCPAAMLDQCNTDADCTANQMCCRSGCFRKCIARPVVNTDKPGKCPTRNNVADLVCAQVMIQNPCQDDSVCPGAKKCCDNGCYRSCVDVADDTVSNPPPPPPARKCSLCGRGPKCGADETCCGCGTSGTCQKGPCMLRCAIGPCAPRLPPPRRSPTKPGSCPANNRLGLMCPMVVDPNDCRDDRSCQGQKKCCTQGCRRVCVDPVDTPVVEVKPGRCPAVQIQIACANVRARNDCSSDASCPGDQKCCSSGCGRTCVDVQANPQPKTCNMCSGVNECGADETCCGCGPTGTCRKGGCPLRCLVAPCPARADGGDDTAFGDEAVVDPAAANALPSPSTSPASDALPNWAVAAFVILGIALVALLVITVQLHVISKRQ